MKIFISRELSSDSLFYSVLPTEKVQLFGESLIAFEQVKLEAIPEVDWCFFSSRNAVKFFIEGLKAAKLSLPSSIQLGTLGEGTSKALKGLGYVADFAGNGDPETVGQAFGIVASGKRVLFPRAAQSRESIQKSLANTVTILDLVVYDNVPLRDFEIPQVDILVFTSPLNAQAYFARYALLEGQKVVAIGRTTAQAIADLGISNVITAPTPTEEVLAEICKSQLAI
jgi:uroporphyrinogen-III synthase